MTLDEAREHIGDAVIFSTHPGEADGGVITSVNDSYVFVRYVRNGAPQATRPQDLTLMRGGSIGEHFRLNMTDAGFPIAGVSGG